MNVFIIPSWYPSNDNPNAGIFNKEQAEALAYIFRDSNFALSTWGSNDHDLLLWAQDHLKNLPKLLKYYSKKGMQTGLSDNLFEYYSPAFTWSRSFFSGNIRRIIEINERHFLDFQQKVGSIDVIHAHSAHPAGWIAMTLSDKYMIPYLITEQMTPFPFPDLLTKKGNMSKWIEKPFLNSYSNIVVSPQQKETLQQWSIPRVKCIPNLVNEDFFKPEPVKTADTKPFTFFTLGNMAPQKGIPYLLQAIKTVTATDKELCFRIGGDGEEEETYHQLAKDLDISAHVQWLGLLNRTQALHEFRNCHAFVLPSLHENLPLVLLEAIACGKPIISTRCGGPESIVNNINGILIPTADSEALSHALRSLKDNIKDYSTDRIRQDFLEKYSRQVVCKQIMDVYRQAVDSYPEYQPTI